MALNTGEVQVAAAAIAADIDGMTLHSGDPGTDGTANTTSASKQAVTPSATDGVITIGSTAFTGGEASGDCAYIGLWAATVFRGSFPLTGDQTFNAAGEYTVTSVTITGSAS